MPKAPERIPFPSAMRGRWVVSRKLEAIAGRRVPLIVAGDGARQPGRSQPAGVTISPDIAAQVLIYPGDDADTAPRL
jgi:hypothetical protein